ncbi:hypothetical protein GCM10007874_33990 [Labrys miyagiensis]|uniref:DUF2167 domain-containing protein n=1 Tax=Labrys miyagiensis TaxID=346912 RepID=A0ABQ6CQ76_9HYPH|nr:DUF2167 domain-containing protein [Labrys miyagiensis]GLS20382.1 hypothetical protein GCM10007874_33990 [Labrys miyagiensis]
MNARRILAAMLAAALLFVGITALQAQETDGQKQAVALQAAVDAMQKVLQPGPVEVKLAGRASLQVPTGAGFVRQPEAGAWAKVVGYDKDVSLLNPDLMGIAIPMSEENWVVFINYHAGTRVVDDSAKDWDPDALLNALKASNEAGNVPRQQRGEPQIEVRGWLEAPKYDSAAHKLIWATSTIEKGGDADEGTANVHAYALGKDSYFELTMVSPANEVVSHLTMAEALLSGLQFGGGQQYGDAVSGGDIKERSLTSLIATLPSSFMDKATAFAAAYWLWLAIGLVILIIVLVGLPRLLRRGDAM